MSKLDWYLIGATLAVMCLVVIDTWPTINAILEELLKLTKGK